jgi:hypothetical protein
MLMKKRRASFCRVAVGAAFGLFVLVGSASAQIVPNPEAAIPERQSVLQRDRPDYQPLGLPLGSFYILPSIDVIEAWNSNIFATPTQDIGDFVTTIQPAVTVASDWNNNALNIVLGDQTNIYATHPTENVNNLTGAIAGRLDVQSGVYFTGGGGAQLLHEDRASPNAAIAGLYPTEYHVIDGNAGFVHDTGVLGFRFNTAVDAYSYNNNVTNTGTPILESTRDNIQYLAIPRLTYEIVPGYHAFIQTPVNERQYVAHSDTGLPGGFYRSSHGYEGDVGTAVNLGSALNGEVFLGYLRQEYEDHRLSTAQGPGGGASILWNITELTSLRFAASRTVQETDIDPASSMLETSGKIALEHELLRNVLLTASGTYFNDLFVGTTRSDNNYNASLGARYLLNRNYSLELDAAYSHRDSNVPGVNYDQEIIGLKFRAQM